MTEAVLSVRGLDKSFYATHAANQVSFDVNRGEIVALLGENGAGKSTVIKILAGVYIPDSGEVLIDGKKINLPSSGSEIAFVHQTLGIIEWMTVAENIAQVLGFPKKMGLINHQEMNRRAKTALSIVGGGIDPETRAFNLSRTDRSLLAIARALILKPKILVLDEPTASLPASDVQKLFSVMRDLKNSGVGIIYVSHRLDEVYEISDRAVIMRNGIVVADKNVENIPKNELVNLIVGKEVLDTKFEFSNSKIQLSLKDFKSDGVGPLTLDIFEGEVVALCGLRGAGQDEIGRGIAGVISNTSGSVISEKGMLFYKKVNEAVRHGIGFSTSNREAEAIAAGLSVRENLFLNPSLWSRRLFQFSTNKKERVKSLEFLDKFLVSPRNPELSLDTLSGGNQQKVILARWFGLSFKVMVLEEPTMGVDIGAKSEIYNIFKDVTEKGASLIIVSTDMEEVVRVANRAVIFLKGKPIAIVDKREISFNHLVSLASHLSTQSLAGGIRE